MFAIQSAKRGNHAVLDVNTLRSTLGANRLDAALGQRTQQVVKHFVPSTNEG